jgi:hypothetical protein
MRVARSTRLDAASSANSANARRALRGPVQLGAARRSLAQLGAAQRSSARLGGARRSSAQLGAARRSSAQLGVAWRCSTVLGGARRSLVEIAGARSTRSTTHSMPLDAARRSSAQLGKLGADRPAGHRFRSQRTLRLRTPPPSFPSLWQLRPGPWLLCTSRRTRRPSAAEGCARYSGRRVHSSQDFCSSSSASLSLGPLPRARRAALPACKGPRAPAPLAARARDDPSTRTCHRCLGRQARAYWPARALLA